jgi:hypothetical protein
MNASMMLRSLLFHEGPENSALPKCFIGIQTEDL